MAKNDVSVSNNFYKAVAKRSYMRESIKWKRQTYQRTKQKSTEPFKESYAEPKAKPS